MFALAIYIGIYSYLIFLLGVCSLLYQPLVVVLTITYSAVLLTVYRRKIKSFLSSLSIGDNKLFGLLLAVVFIQALVNLIGVFGPEISFDALWYHLTLPKLYIEAHQIIFIPGVKMAYSVMPKLTEMLYTAALLLANDSVAKLIHFTFGILTLLALYRLSRKFLSREFSLLAAVIFYANLVVGWETITAYVDLSRTFFELMAVWGFINYLEIGKRKWLIVSAVMLGLAVTVKLVAAFSLLIFLALFVYKKLTQGGKWAETVKNYALFFVVAFMVPLPWFIFSYLTTGNPFYPYLSHVQL